MAKVCFILVAGLDGTLLKKIGELTCMRWAKVTPVQPVWPAVTCTVQATLTTGEPPARHGIIANGLYTHGRSELLPKLDLSNTAEFRRQVSFWEQSNELLDAPRLWAGSGRKVAMLFWQNSMPGKASPPADIVITPKPEHTPDGKTLTACWSNPRELYAEQSARFGPFPLHHYWGPMAGLPSSQWIIKSAIDVWQRFSPDLQLVYIPHMDYSLQRLGPGNAAVVEELRKLDAELTALVDAVRATGGTPVICGDYGMSDVSTAVLPNVALRQAQLLVTNLDPNGKCVVDYQRSRAFAMCDHQVAHVYTRPELVQEVESALFTLPGLRHIVTDPAEIAALGLAHPRTGSLVMLAHEDAWFAHDWWTSEAEKPVWQYGVDIHRKPGYDPRELFFDPVKKIVVQNLGVVKGSHGLVSDDHARWPVVLADESFGHEITMAQLGRRLFA